MRRYLVIAAYIVAALLVLEGLAFGIFKLVGYERYRPPEIVNPHHPYLGWVHAPNITVKATNCDETTSLVQTDTDGYSLTPHYAFSEPELRIVITGASAVFGVGTTDNSATVASILEKLIVEETGISAEVHNLAVRGYQSFQEMLGLLRFSAAYDFDLAIAISGHNDTANAAMEQARQSALLPGNPHRASEFVRSAEREDFILRSPMTLLRSCCHTFDLLAQLAGIDDPSGRAQTPGRLPSSKRRPSQPSFDDIPQRARITATNYALMDRIAHRKDAEFILVLQPTPHTKQVAQKDGRVFECGPDMPRDDFDRFKQEFLHRFYTEFLGLDKPYTFIDARGAFDSGSQESFFYRDKGHYNDHGAAALARYLLEQIRPRILEIVERKRQATPDARVAVTAGAVTVSEDELSGRVSGER